MSRYTHTPSAYAEPHRSIPQPAAARYAVEAENLVSSKALFARGNRNLLIEHEGSIYRLTLTRQNKLILTK